MGKRALSEAQRMALEWGDRTGFCRTSSRSIAMIEAGLTMHTVAGLVRRGWIEEYRSGMYRITPAGRAALKEPSDA